MEVVLNWLVIVNRKAGGGYAASLWKKTEGMLSAAGIEFTARYTEAPAQTRLIAANTLNMGFSGLAVFGGDGTMSDAAAAVSGNIEKPVLAFLPAGSGNDWIRSLGFNPSCMKESIAAMVACNTKQVDSGICRWSEGSRFFLNSAGVGFDALVLKRSISLKRITLLKSFSYMLTLFGSALFPPHWSGTLSCDGTPFYRGDYFTLTVGIGKYSGGGMQLSPCSVIDDGLLDALCISPMGFIDIAKCFSRIFDGTLHSTIWATGARGSNIRLEPLKPGSFLLELDGEKVSTGDNSRYVEFISVPADLTVVIPRSEQG